MEYWHKIYLEIKHLDFDTCVSGQHNKTGSLILIDIVLLSKNFSLHKQVDTFQDSGLESEGPGAIYLLENSLSSYWLTPHFFLLG